eukprot:SAG11_NODE_9625_length_895_cov_1.214824_1_plen_170_part_10
MSNMQLHVLTAAALSSATSLEIAAALASLRMIQHETLPVLTAKVSQTATTKSMLAVSAWNQTCADCHGVPAGEAIMDGCGECQIPGTPAFDRSCRDCSGALGGNYTLDACGMCYAPNDARRDSGCRDCNNVTLGGFTMDACGSCLHPRDPRRNTSCMGCDGVVVRGRRMV